MDNGANSKKQASDVQVRFVQDQDALQRRALRGLPRGYLISMSASTPNPANSKFQKHCLVLQLCRAGALPGARKILGRAESSTPVVLGAHSLLTFPRTNGGCTLHGQNKRFLEVRMGLDVHEFPGP